MVEESMCNNCFKNKIVDKDFFICGDCAEEIMFGDI